MYQLPSLFEGYKNASLFPSIDTAVHGLEQAKYGKEPFKLTDYKVKIFNMAVSSESEAYCKLMQRLMPLCQNAQCVVTKNELQVLNRPDGQSWYRYVEWFEYKLNETSLTTKTEPEETDEPEDSNDSNDEDDHGGIW